MAMHAQHQSKAIAVVTVGPAGLLCSAISAIRNTNRKGKDMFAKWTDEMVREYFDTHWNATLHEICALSGRTKADVKRVLMGG